MQAVQIGQGGSLGPVEAHIRLVAVGAAGRFAGKLQPFYRGQQRPVLGGEAAALRDVSIACAAAAVLQGVEQRLGRLDVADLRDALLWRGERVAVDDVEGTLLDIAEDGSLVIETDDGERAMRAGTLRRTN